MPTCSGKICSFCLLCVSFVNVYQFKYVFSFPFGFEGGMWDVLLPDYCLSFYFTVYVFSIRTVCLLFIGNLL